jgi:hypothetical protein
MRCDPSLRRCDRIQRAVAQAAELKLSKLFLGSVPIALSKPSGYRLGLTPQAVCTVEAFKMGTNCGGRDAELARDFFVGHSFGGKV